MTTVDVPAGPFVAESTIPLRLTGVRVMQARIGLGTALLELVGRVLLCKVQLVSEEPPATSYGVAVEKVGGHIGLRIGDRGVGLDPTEA